MRTFGFLVVLCFFGCKDRPDALGDRPLGTRIHFSTLHYPDGAKQPRRFGITGTLDGSGELSLDPNTLILDSDGKVTGSTLLGFNLGFNAIPVQIRAVDTPDPVKLGRKIYEIVAGNSGAVRKYSLALSPTELGPHDLLVHADGKLVGTHKLADPNREEHLFLEPTRAKACAAEQKAIADLRKAIGYSFRFRAEVGTDITYLYFPTADDIGALDPHLGGLKNLLSLYFQDGRLRGEGLKSLRKMGSLKTLSFTNAEIEDGALACVKDSVQLESMSFFGCRGISDGGLSHFSGLKNLKLLDLRNESFTPDKPAGPRITDAGLKHLAGLNKIEYLNLQGQSITDEGLMHLGGMTDLRTLALSFSGITDAGLKHLEGLRNLRKIHLYGTRVTPEGRAALKVKLPLIAHE